MTSKQEIIVKWLNDNQGLLTIIIFFATIIAGWVSGIFRSLIKKPKFKIRVMPKMTFGTVYLTGGKYTPPGYGEYDLHVTAIVVYIEITNVGSAPSNLGKIKIGYYKDDGKKTWFQKRLWMHETNVLADFIINDKCWSSGKFKCFKFIYIIFDVCIIVMINQALGNIRIGCNIVLK
jgi:hypothetical protein